MSTFNDPPVQALLEQPNHASISTHNADGSILSTVVWVSAEDGNRRRQQRARPQVADEPRARPATSTSSCTSRTTRTDYVEVRGTATATETAPTSTSTRLPRSTSNQDEYPFRAARRGADQVRDRAGARPLPEAGLGCRRRVSARRLATAGFVASGAIVMCAGGVLELALDARRGRAPARTAASRCAASDDQHHERTQIGQKLPWAPLASQMAVQTRNAHDAAAGLLEHPALQSARRCAARPSAALATGGQRRQVGLSSSAKL